MFLNLNNRTDHRDALRKSHLGLTVKMLVLFICSYLGDMMFVGNFRLIEATSINYGVNQMPISDIKQLMPQLCQNQSVICEGSFCIPGVRKCVCDLRMPVQFGRFCLRQIDIDTKCFATNQCNHTIKDAVCIDINSNSILDAESSKFKLDQWQHLKDLRQQSQSALTYDSPKQFQTIPMTTESINKQMFLLTNHNHVSQSFETRDDIVMSHSRNSPYEINYNTPELLLQNHTRRRTNHGNRTSSQPIPNITSPVDPVREIPVESAAKLPNSHSDPKSSTPESSMTTLSQTTSNSVTIDPVDSRSAISNLATSNIESTKSSIDELNPTSVQAPIGDMVSKKKMVMKSPNWPPGICSCPFGYMFDSMLRKCLALSLVDSHCQVDGDCRQIPMSHCSHESKKCQCDEPLVWDPKGLSCERPKIQITTETPGNKRETAVFLDNLFNPLTYSKLIPDYTLILLIFVILVVVGTLVIMKLIVKCFSSSNSALISPKTKKKKPSPNHSAQKSPYATLRRPDHKPNSQFYDQSEDTRGRILNYDFEQESPKIETGHARESKVALDGNTQSGKGNHPPNGKRGTKKDTDHSKNYLSSNPSNTNTSPRNPKLMADENDSEPLELGDNVSIGQLESESKSDNSILTIPGPPPSHQPPYMLTSVMKVHGSAIAAAAAAVANKRMQKKLEQSASIRPANGSPVFL